MADSSTGRVLQVRHARPDAFVLRCERQGLDFRPGQHVNLGLAGAGINREYSIYSGTDDPWLEFLVKIHPGSDSALALASAPAGTAVTVAGPYGGFLLPPDVIAGRPVWLIAGGVGIAPFHSMVRSVPNLDYHLLHGVRSPDEAYDRPDYAPERHTLCCSRTEGGDFRGRVTDWLAAHALPPDAMALVCGSGAMVANTYEALRRQGLSSDRILVEVFFQ